MPKPLEFAAPVPIVGQAFTAHEGVVLATLTCRCRPDNPPLLIGSTQLAAVCRHCRHQYVIAAVAFDRRTGQTAPNVAIADIGVMATPQELTQS